MSAPHLTVVQSEFAAAISAAAAPAGAPPIAPQMVPEAQINGYDFDEEFQTKIAALTLRDTVFATRADGIVRPEYFANEAEAQLVKLAVGYFETYRKAPDKSVFAVLIRDAVASNRIRKDMVPEVIAHYKSILATDISDRDFCLDQVSTFARHKAVEDAILKSVAALDKGDFASIQKLIREAVDVGVGGEGISYNYWEEVANRTTKRKEIAAGTFKRTGITTGHADLDKVLYHGGWGRKELSVMMGAAKAGKSMSLGEFAKNAALAGKTVLYVTLEVAAEIIADRVDASLSDVMMNNLTTSPFEVQRKVEAAQAKAGQLLFEEFPSGTMKPSMLRRLLERYRARGIIFDLVVVDYADIMAPEHRVEKETENSKSIYIDLRAISWEYDCALLTATQTNREGAKSVTAKMTDVAEDFNKIRIADIVISINASEDEKAAGEARLFFAAARNGESGFTLRIAQDRSRMKFLVKILGRE